jgi:hypothetical protein
MLSRAPWPRLGSAEKHRESMQSPRGLLVLQTRDVQAGGVIEDAGQGDVKNRPRT